MNNLKIKIAELPQALPEIQAIRQSVFQVEQKVAPELDFDGYDATADQLIACLDNQPVGTARIRYLNAQTAKIERLAVLATARKQGVGKQLMQYAVELAAQKNMQTIVIHAQVYIQGLYQQLGFEPEGERFLEAGIAHVKMRKKLQ